MSPKPDIPGYDHLVARLTAADESRVSFLRACLKKLGLEPNTISHTVPSLSTLHLSAVDNTQVTEMLSSWEAIMDKENGEELIRAEADTFCIQIRNSPLNMDELRASLPEDDRANAREDGTIDYGTIVKKIVAHETSPPSMKQTPRFNHKLYYSSLQRYQIMEPDAESWGNVLLYGDVLTSTNTILDKLVNPNPYSIVRVANVLPGTRSSCPTCRPGSLWQRQLKFLRGGVARMCG